MLRAAIFLGFLCLLAPTAQSEDRLAAEQALEASYEQAVEQYREMPRLEEPTDEQRIERLEAWPAWEYIPQFLKLADAQPDDEAAFRCCQWIIDRTGNVGIWEEPMYSADQNAWKILAAHHTQPEKLPSLCFQAVQYDAAAREDFLRGLLLRDDLSHDNRGFATVSLAELLAHRVALIELDALRDRLERSVHELSEYQHYLIGRKSPEYGKDFTAENLPKFKAESIQLFREALAKYDDVPVTISEPYFRNLETLGDKASKSLHALEHLTLGAEAPAIVGNDLEGKPLDLKDYRGKVVVLSFWFTGCSPCIAMIPQEQRLIEKYEGRPFALLAVCLDEDRQQAQETAKQHAMTWPNWYDGEDQAIHRDWNVLSWPTVYVLDAQGRIAAKGISGDLLEDRIAELMAELSE